MRLLYSVTVVLLYICVGVSAKREKSDVNELLGAKRCTWGPSYWCAGIEPAKECNAVKHCSDAVWGKMILMEDEPCQLCLDAIQAVEKYIAENATEAKIISYLMQMCTVLGNEADQCRAVVEAYGPEIIQMIEAQATPQVVCAALKFCKQQSSAVGHTSAVGHGQALQLTDMVGGPFCDLCVQYLQQIENYLTDPKTEQSIESLLQKACALIPDKDLADTCNQDIQKWVPEILNLIVSNLKPQQACQDIGLCTTGPWTQDQCSECKTFVEGISAAMETSDFTKSVEEMMDNACNQLDEYLQSECKDIVSSYIPTMVKAIADSIDSAKFCKVVGLCALEIDGSSTPPLIKNPEELTFALMDRQHEIISLAKEHISKLTKPVTVSSGSQQCALCEFILNTVDKELAENATQQEIIEALDQVCSMLPSTLSSECTQFINEYGPAILNLLSKDISPKQVCTMLGLCTSAQPIVIPAKPTPEQTDEDCTMCRVIITYLDTQLKEESTKDEIEEVLEKMCHLLPAKLDIQEKCDEFVQQWGPFILQEVAKGLDAPDIVCSTLGLCNSELLALHDDTKCEKFGFSYWCASKETAQACKMENYCKKYFWKKATVENL